MLTDDSDVEFCPLGDSAVVVKLGEEIHSKTHGKIIKLSNTLESKPFHGFIEAVPSYNSVTVYYNPFEVHAAHSECKYSTAYEIVSAILMNYMKKISSDYVDTGELFKIPVLYGGKYGPDLDFVARYNNLTREEVISIHTNKDYLVYMIGFAPGFPYLAGIDKKIATPRKDKPRPLVPARSVGIAGEQTGLYTLDSPGGWQIIGQTPIELFTPEKIPPTLLKPGDKVQFYPITEEDFLSYKEIRNER